jgi:hypothetical protein
LSKLLQQHQLRRQQSGSTIVSMPALGESVTEGTVTRWLKKVGDQLMLMSHYLKFQLTRLILKFHHQQLEQF